MIEVEETKSGCIQNGCFDANDLRNHSVEFAKITDILPTALKNLSPKLPTEQELLSFIEYAYEIEPITRITPTSKTNEHQATAMNILRLQNDPIFHLQISSLHTNLTDKKLEKLSYFSNKLSQVNLQILRTKMTSPMKNIYQQKKMTWQSFNGSLYQFTVIARLFLWMCRDLPDASSYPPSASQMNLINESWRSLSSYSSESRYGSTLNPISVEDSNEYMRLYAKFDLLRAINMYDTKSSPPLDNFNSFYSKKDELYPPDDIINNINNNLNNINNNYDKNDDTNNNNNNDNKCDDNNENKIIRKSIDENIFPTKTNEVKFIFYSISFKEGANFSNENFTQLNLQGISIPSANLNQSNFSYSKLLNAKLICCFGENVRFEYCDLREANLRKCKFRNSSFIYSDFRGATLNESEFNNCNFEKSKFGGGLTEFAVYNQQTQILSESVFFFNCNLNFCDFSMANLQGIELQNNNSFQEIDLRGANLEYANLSGVHFQGIHVGPINAEFTNSGNKAMINLFKTSMAFTNCSNCTFEKVNFNSIETSRTNFSNCSFVKCNLDLMKMRLCLLSNSNVDFGSKLLHLSYGMIADLADRGVNFDRYNSDQDLDHDLFKKGNEEFDKQFENDNLIGGMDQDQDQDQEIGMFTPITYSSTSSAVLNSFRSSPC